MLRIQLDGHAVLAAQISQAQAHRCGIGLGLYNTQLIGKSCAVCQGVGNLLEGGLNGLFIGGLCNALNSFAGGQPCPVAACVKDWQ